MNAIDYFRHGGSDWSSPGKRKKRSQAGSIDRPSEGGTVFDRMNLDKQGRERQKLMGDRYLGEAGEMAGSLLEKLSTLGGGGGGAGGRTSGGGGGAGGLSSLANLIAPKEDSYNAALQSSSGGGYQIPPAMRSRQEADEWGVNSADKNEATYNRFQQEERDYYANKSGRPQESIADKVVNQAKEQVVSQAVGDESGLGPSEEWKRQYYKSVGSSTGEDPEVLYQKGEDFIRQHGPSGIRKYLSVQQRNQGSNNQSQGQNTPQTPQGGAGGGNNRQQVRETPPGTNGASSDFVNSNYQPQVQSTPQTYQGGGNNQQQVNSGGGQTRSNEPDPNLNVVKTRNEGDYEGIQTRGLDEIQSRSNKDLGKLALLAGLMKFGNNVGSAPTARWW